MPQLVVQDALVDGAGAGGVVHPAEDDEGERHRDAADDQWVPALAVGPLWQAREAETAADLAEVVRRVRIHGIASQQVGEKARFEDINAHARNQVAPVAGNAASVDPLRLHPHRR